MCVTNTTHRRVQAVTLTPNQVGVCPSVLSQRLLGTLPSKGQHVVSFPAAKPQQSAAVASVPQPYVCPMPAEKPRPKRRRKPQKPGKTAKLNDRHFVKHNYHDHAFDREEDFDAEEHDAHHHEDDEHHHDDHEESGRRRRGGVAVAFPLKLHAVLDQVEADGLANVISWMPHGRCFVVHKPKEFVDHVMPKYFRQTKLTSFQRQLNLYGFSRLTRGPDAGGYYHEVGFIQSNK